MNRNTPTDFSHNSAQDVSALLGTGPAGSMLTFNNGNTATSNSPDRRNISDDRIHLQRGRHPDFETTPDGNVLIIEPSFDDTCQKVRITPSKNPAELQGQTGPPPDIGEHESAADGSRGSSLLVAPDGGAAAGGFAPNGATGFANGKHIGRHTRDLSAHFFDATTLTRDGSNDSTDTFEDGPDGMTESRKHRRMLSGDGSNPSLAHRRLNSIGNSEQVQRRRHHHREPSAGLDILSAAADFTREELARAADTNKHGGGQMAGGPMTEQHASMPPYTRAPSMGIRPFPPAAHHMPPPQARRYGHAPEGPPPPPAEYGYLPYHPSYTIYNGSQHMHQYPVQYQMQQPPMMNKPPQLGAPAGPPEMYHSSRPQDAAGRPSTTQGSQTFVTAMAVGGNKTIRPTNSFPGPAVAATSHSAPVPSQINTQNHHHRRMSSFSSLGIGTLFGGINNGGGSPEKDPSHPLKDHKKHHRTTSSSVSFLNALDVAGMDGNADDTFLRNLQESTSAYAPAFCKPVVEEVPSSSSQQSSAGSDSDGQPTRLASGGTSKRIRRKCTVGGCANRVVQGGLCISHGAKRKTCNHPGCNKNVKKAGLCSTHGPARKRCDAPGCVKVAVQGGRCIAHGAKKKLCSFDNCPKQAILAGMCKKHHDQSRGEGGGGGGGSGDSKKASHNRGLSIFHDISADAVQSIINADTLAQSSPTAWQP